jgi:hypothetical protein
MSYQEDAYLSETEKAYLEMIKPSIDSRKTSTLDTIMETTK